MKLSGLRELLLKKTNCDPYTHTLIKHMSDEKLQEYVLESLEKMAHKRDFLGSHANHAEREFASKMDADVEGAMLRDAIGHHASHYKAALKSGNDNLATKHAKQLRRLVSLGLRAQNHSDGELQIEAPDIKPWERNAYTKLKEKYADGGHQQKHYSTATKGFHTKAGGHDWMRKPPHWSYEGDQSYTKYKDQAYPLRDIKVNGKYIHIDHDIESPGEYTPHEFDNHPVVGLTGAGDHTLTPEKRAKFLEAFHAFEESDHAKSWLDRHEKLRTENEEMYEKRGIAPSDPVHGDDFRLPADHFPPSLKEAKQEINDKDPKTDFIDHGEHKIGPDNVHDLFSNKKIDFGKLEPNHIKQIGEWMSAGSGKKK